MNPYIQPAWARPRDQPSPPPPVQATAGTPVAAVPWVPPPRAPRADDDPIFTGRQPWDWPPVVAGGRDKW